MDTAFKLITLIDSTSGGSETIYGEEIGIDEFKIAETPAFNCKINYGTIVKAIENDKGELIFEKVLKVSDYKCRRFLFGSALSRTEMEILGSTILADGGYWEVLFGGMLCVHLLLNSNLDLNSLFRDLNYSPTEIADN